MKDAVTNFKAYDHCTVISSTVYTIIILSDPTTKKEYFLNLLLRTSKTGIICYDDNPLSVRCQMEKIKIRS